MSELKVASCFEFEKVLRGKSNKLFYPKSEVDATIDELKEELYNQKWRGDEWARNANVKDKQIAELKAENERLVKCCKEYDSRQRIDERLKFSYLQQLRATKRALWLARATIAHSTRYKYHRLYSKAEMDPQPHGWSCYINGEVYRTGKMNRMLEPHYWIELWEEVERKCLKKAEEDK